MRNLLLLLFISISFISFSQENKLEHYNADGLNFDYPNEWIKEKQKNGDLFFYPLYDFIVEKPFGVAISKIKEIQTEEASTTAYLTLTLTSLKRFQDAEIVKNEVIEINGIKAFMYEYEIKKDETHDYGKMIILRKGSTAYQITMRGTFRSYMDYQMFAESIIQSFKF
jgi:hypothetical protein